MKPNATFFILDKSIEIFAKRKKQITFATVLKEMHIIRGVAQLGLEYSSGGRGVASSNPVTPTY